VRDAPSRFVGRSAELSRLAAARRDLSRGRGSITLVDGEAGIGKSRLVAHALRSVGGGRSSRIVQVDCVPEHDGELYPVRIALAQLWERGLAATSPSLALRAVAQLVPEVATDHHFPGVTLARGELFAGLAAALAAAGAKRGTILVLEDIHWADPTTVEFLATLGAQIGAMRLMVVATARSEAFEREELHDAVSRLLRGANAQHVALQPLPRTAIAGLVRETLDSRHALDAATVAAIAERSDGNPFFAEELVKAASTGDGATLPLSIRASIRHRLAVLAPADRAMLDVAAALGARFDYRALAQLTGDDAAAVLRMLRAARDANIVDEVDASTYRFHHALTREAIYERLLIAETQALHRRILRALEAAPATDRAIEALAYHAWRAGDPVAIQRYSERAGDWSLERGLFTEARSYYERMLPDADAAARARITERLGTIGTALGDFGGAIGALERALAMRVERAEFADAARIAVALAVERSNSGGDALPELEAFLAHYDAQLDARARDAVLVFIARMLTATGGFARAESMLARIAQPDLMEPRVHANFITCRLNTSEHRGDVAGWRRAAQEMIALGDRLPPLMRSIQLTNVAQTGAWFGEVAVTRTALQSAQEIARHWGFEGIFTFSLAIEALLSYLAGDLDAARAALDAVAGRPAIAPALVVATRIAPFVAAECGDDDLALRFLDPATIARVRAGDDRDDQLFLEAGLLAGRPGPRGPAARARLASALEALPDGAFVPPPIAVVAARELDLRTAVRLCDALSATHPAAAATRDLARAIVAARGGEPTGALAASAATAFATFPWPRFAAAAHALTGTADARAEPGPVLTSRETEVARLIATGSSNAAIAAHLNVGVKTVEKHVSSILQKLNARSRAQIAVFAAAQDADGGRVPTHTSAR
jgi:DNA-binding NarL/FixJ family response regulator